MTMKFYYLKEDLDYNGPNGLYKLKVSPRPKGNKRGEYAISEKSAIKLIDLIGRDKIGIELDEGTIEISGTLEVGKGRTL